MVLRLVTALCLLLEFSSLDSAMPCSIFFSIAHRGDYCLVVPPAMLNAFVILSTTDCCSGTNAFTAISQFLSQFMIFGPLKHPFELLIALNQKCKKKFVRAGLQ